MTITTRQYIRALGIIVVALVGVAAASMVGRAYRPADAVAEQARSSSPVQTASPVRSRRLRTALATCRADLEMVRQTARSR